MNVADVMTSGLVSVGPKSTVAEVARLMLEHHVSGLPVVDGGKLVGMISERDLMRRGEIGTAPRPSRWAAFFASEQQEAAEFVHAHGRTAADVMTRKLITVTPQTPLAEAADLLDRHRIKRLPVLDNGTLVGIVARADLLRALAGALARPAAPAANDALLRDAVVATLHAQPWGRMATRGTVMVESGIVHLWGTVLDDKERRACVIAAEAVPGVNAVTDHMTLWHDIDPYNRPGWTSSPPIF
jgi:CBS domain-containing protein